MNYARFGTSSMHINLKKKKSYRLFHKRRYFITVATKISIENPKEEILPLWRIWRWRQRFLRGDGDKDFHNTRNPK